MRKRLGAKALVPVALLALGGIATAGVILTRPQPTPRDRPTVAPLVRVVRAEPRDLELVVRSQGTTTARTAIDLVAEVGGRIVEIADQLRSGGFFANGDLLVRIDPRDYALAVERARAEVARARTVLERETAEAAVARTEWQALGGPDEPPPLVARKPQVAEAKAALAAAQAALAQARLDLERTEIRAPFDGRVLEEMVDIGEFVAAGATIARIFATDAVEVRLPLPIEELAYVDLPLHRPDGKSPARKVAVRLHGKIGGQTHTWSGFIERTEGAIDERNRMLYAVAVVKDPYGLDGTTSTAPLPLGLFVEAEIVGRRLPDAIVLPRAALRDTSRVLVVDEEDRLRFRDVVVARSQRDEVIVTGGLEAGERVCISPLDIVTDGMPVRVADGEDRGDDRMADATDLGGP